nr:hypothetical protein [Tanacetum cinerariifolium]
MLSPLRSTRSHTPLATTRRHFPFVPTTVTANTTTTPLTPQPPTPPSSSHHHTADATIFGHPSRHTTFISITTPLSSSLQPLPSITPLRSDHNHHLRVRVVLLEHQGAFVCGFWQWVFGFAVNSKKGVFGVVISPKKRCLVLGETAGIRLFGSAVYGCLDLRIKLP